MISFSTFESRAQQRKEGRVDELVQERLSPVKSNAQLAAVTDDRWLSTIAKCVFAAGFRWRVVQAKWPDFEEAFAGFDPQLVSGLSAAAEQALTQDRRVIRNPQKIRATIDNAAFVRRVAAEHGGFGRFIADWPDDDTVGLWAWLKKEGARLGGDTGPRVLRRMGKDTFILTADVTYALNEAGIMTAKASSKTGRRQAQEAFNAWRAETGRPAAELSVVLAMSVDRPR